MNLIFYVALQYGSAVIPGQSSSMGGITSIEPQLAGLIRIYPDDA